MNTEPDQAIASAGELMQAHLRLIATDLPAWLELLSDDAEIEFPYVELLGFPTTLRGKAAIGTHMSTTLKRLTKFTFSDIKVCEASSGNEAWASFTGHAVVAGSGATYLQIYATHLKTRDGKIVHYREFWDPLRVARAFGIDLSALPAPKEMAK